MKKAALAILICLIVSASQAQQVEDSIKTAVNRLFVSMARSDSAAIVASFTDDGILQSISDKDGKTTIETEKLTDFGHVIAGLLRGEADEQIKFNTIKVDGALAMVWAQYNFFFKGKFSHCGVDCFELVRINGEWKIQYLIDTRRKNGCKY